MDFLWTPTRFPGLTFCVFPLRAGVDFLRDFLQQEREEAGSDPGLCWLALVPSVAGSVGAFALTIFNRARLRACLATSCENRL